MNMPSTHLHNFWVHRTLQKLYQDICIDILVLLT